MVNGREKHRELSAGARRAELLARAATSPLSEQHVAVEYSMMLDDVFYEPSEPYLRSLTLLEWKEVAVPAL